MKIRIILFATIMLIVGLTETAYCQPPPPPSIGHGDGNNQPANGAPVGDGLLILISLGAAYATKKSFHLRKKKNDIE
jgi:hypothetical protein